MRSHLATLAVVGLVAASPVLLAGGGGTLTASRQTAPPALERLPGQGVPVEKTHTYRLAGRIRPLLFWFGKDDVGLGRIVWRRSPTGARGYDFLVGTDPAKAPRALNRWGYVSEEATGADGALFALMTRSEESSYDDANTSTARTGAGAGTEFRALHARLDAGTVTSRVAPVQATEPLDVFDVDAALDRIRRETAAATPRQTRARAEARPGFLVAVADLVDRAVAARTPAQRSDVLATVVPYAFGRSAYELRLREIETVRGADGGGVPQVRLPFEIRTLATDARTRFELLCGTQGDLAGVPVRIDWQPRWWLRLELHLDDQPGRAAPPVSR
jgi:hypothetical protein